MGTIGSVIISMFAPTDRLKKDLKKGESAVADSAKSFDRLGKVASGAIAAFSAVKISQWMAATAEATVMQNRLAREIGTTQGQLESLGYAAEQSGVNQGDLTSALGGLQATLLDADTNFSRTTQALDGLGLSTHKLASQDPAKSFTEIADALGKIDDPIKRAAAGTQIFGSEWVKVSPLLAKGAAEIEKLKGDADRLGVVVEGQSLNRIETLNSAWHDMGTAFDGMAKQFTATFGPLLTDLVNLITGVVSKITEGLKSLGNVVGDIEGMLPDWVTGGELKAHKLPGAGGAAGGAGAAAMNALGAGGGVVGTNGAIGKGKGVGIYEGTIFEVEKYRRQILDLQGALKTGQLDQMEFNHAQAELTRQLRAGYLDKMAPAATRYTEALKPLKRLLDANVISQQEYGRATLDAMRNAFGERSVDPLIKTTTRLDDLKDALDKGMLTWEGYQRASKEALGIDLKPMEQLRERLTELDAARKRGAISQQTFNEQSRKAALENLGENKLAANVQFGSAESVSLVNQYRAKFNDPALNLGRQQLDIAKQQLAELRKGNGSKATGEPVVLAF